MTADKEGGVKDTGSRTLIIVTSTVIRGKKTHTVFICLGHT
jgi:hypothetical protein